MNQVSSRNSDG